MHKNEQADARPGQPSPHRETKFSGANGDREKVVFPVQLTITSRIYNILMFTDDIVVKCFFCKPQAAQSAKYLSEQQSTNLA